MSSARSTECVDLVCSSPGTRRHVKIHTWGRPGAYRVYIQASLHADEIPGLLVANHLMKLLDDANLRKEIVGEVVIVPFANPIGLSQQLNGHHLGRFCFETGQNFNRDWIDCTDTVAEAVTGKLTADAAENIKMIRQAIYDCVSQKEALEEDVYLKKLLLERACVSDVCLDLHCDGDAVLHMYTHDRLWPQLADLSQEIGTECQIVDSDSGGNCFDEACMNIWARLADKFPTFPIPMGCEASTVELRGQDLVYDDIARTDALALYRFLQRRGVVLCSPYSPPYTYFSTPPALEITVRSPSPLTAVDMVKSPCAGVVAWLVRPGAEVVEGQVLGEIVNVDDVDAPRVAVVSRTTGIVFGMRNHKLVRPGQIIIKVAGTVPLPWRSGKLLTS